MLEDRPSAATRFATRIALTIVVLCAVLLALKWATVVPIFQNPDEPMHADYAFALADAHHVLRVSDARGADIADPTTSYLEARADFFGMAFHPTQHVAPNYGTPSYYRAIDAAAPLAAISAYAHDGSPAPNLSAIYPVGYYALGAVAVTIGRSLSFVDGFFALRVLDGLLLGVTLVLGYALLRALGTPRLAALAIVAIAGLFPEQTFFSASVQPDTLAQALMTAVLLVALKLRRHGTMALALGAGMLLTALFLVKIQFFAAALVAVAASVCARALRARTPARTVFAWCAVMVVPVIAAWRFQTWIYARGQGIPTASAQQHAQLGAAIGHGFFATAAFVGAQILAALRDFFYDGTSTASYWGDFGWLDTPLSFGSPALSATIARIVQLGSLAIAASCAIVIIRLAVRIVRAGRRRGVRVALVLALRDPALIAFLAFTAIMTMLYVGLGDAWGFQGRYWLPLSIVSWYFAVMVAPRILVFPAAIRAARAAIAALLLAYSCVGSAFAFPTIVARYYAPNDAFGAVAHQFIPVDRPVSHTIESATTEDAAFHVSGWCAPEGPLRAIAVIVDGKPTLSTTILRRPDVASAFHDSHLVMTGFSADTHLTAGPHTIRLACIGADGSTEYNLAERYHVTTPR